MLGPLRDESALANTGQIVEVSYAIVKVRGRPGLEHSDVEILREVQFTVMSPADPFSAKYRGRFQDEGSSMRAHLKSFWSLMGNKLKLVVMPLFLCRVGS